MSCVGGEALAVFTTLHGAAESFGLVSGSVVKPAGDDYGRAHAGDVAGEEKKGLLGGVLGRAGVAEYAQRCAEYHAFVAAQENGERVLVAGDKGAEQRVVILGGSRW